MENNLEKSEKSEEIEYFKSNSSNMIENCEVEMKKFSFQKKASMVVEDIHKRKSVTGFELFELLKSEDFCDSLNVGNNRSKTAIFKRSVSLNNTENTKQRNNTPVNQSLLTEEENQEIEDNSRSSMNSSVVDNLIDRKLREMKEKMLQKIDEYKDTLETKYEDHIERIKRNVLQKARRIKQVFNNNIKHNESSSTPTNSPKKEYEYMRRYTFKNVGAKLDNIFDIHGKIESSINENFDILGNFLDAIDIFQDNPLQLFINDNADHILNSWIFSKINFEKINLINLLENDKIPTNLKNFIFQDTVNKFSIISIKKSKNYDFEKKLMYDNHLILEKLCFKNLDHEEFLKVFSQVSSIEGIIFKKLKEILLLDCTMDSVSFTSLFPNTEKIKMKNCRIKMRFDNLSQNFLNLKILSIRKSNLNNLNVNSLMKDLSNCKQLLESLEVLDLSNNKISQFDLTPISDNNSKFYALQVLVLDNNKLYKFKAQNLSLMPNLKLVNLSSNNFTAGKDFYEIKERAKKTSAGIFISMNKNLFMMNDANHNRLYVEYLVETLPQFEFFLRKLDISFVFNTFNNISIYKLYLNSNIQISLKKINLSYSSLDANSLVTFFKNNNGFINLRVLEVSNNFLDDIILDAYVTENFIHLFENLEYINFSYNQITHNSLTNLENILKNQKKLNKIKLSGNPVEYSFVEYFSNSIEREDSYVHVNEFIENLNDIKKEFKIVLSKKAENSINSNTSPTSTGFSSKKYRDLNKIVIFE